MKKVSVQSSNIKRVGYNPYTETLEIEFRSKVRYIYCPVPGSIYRALLETDQSGESVGSWFHENVKEAGFPFFKVEKGQKVPGSQA